MYDSDTWLERSKGKGELGAICQVCLKFLPPKLDPDDHYNDDTCGCGNYASPQEIIKAHGLEQVNFKVSTQELTDIQQHG